MDNLDNLKNDIKIPNGIDLAVKKGIERGKKDKRKKKLQSTYKKVAAVIAILVVTTSFVVTHPNIAMAIPGVKSIFKLVGYGNLGQNFEKLDEFASGINETIEKNGIKVTINEITIDDNTLAITSTFQGENLREDIPVMGHIILNEKLVDGWDSKDKKIDDNTIVTVTYANVADLELTDVVDVKLEIIWIGKVKGPWNFEFQTAKADKATNSKVINLDKTVKIPDSTLKYENIVMSPLGNTLNYSGTYDEPYEDFSEYNYNMKTNIVDFTVIDDKGRRLRTNRGDFSGSKEDYQGKLEILNDLTNVKSLTIIPMFKPVTSKCIKVDNFPCSYPILQTTMNSTNLDVPQETIINRRPTTEAEKRKGYILDEVIHVFNIDKDRSFSALDGLIKQSIKVGNDTIAIIKNIEISEADTKVTFKLEGNGLYPAVQVSDIVIIDEDYNDVDRTDDRGLAVVENADEGIVSMKLPPIDKAKKYKIALPIIEEPEIDEQYKVNIDLIK